MPISEVVRIISLEVLPYLLGFFFAAPVLLRIWIAARDIQLPGSNDNQGAKKQKFILVLMVFAAILGSEIVMLFMAASTGMDAVLTLVLVIAILVYACFTAKFIQETIQVTKRSVHRNIHGLLVYRYVESGSKARRIASTVMTCLLALVIPIAAFLTGWTILTAAVLTASVYTMSRIVYMSIAMRTVIIASLCCGGLIILLAGVMASRSVQEPHSLDLKSALEDSWLALYLSRKPLFFPPVLALMPGTLMGMAYRFDYRRYLNSLDTSPVVMLSSVPAFDRNHGPGFIIPTSIPTKFSKPYFIASLTAWTVVRIIRLIALNAVGYSDDFFSTAAIVGLEQPLMCTALICFAAFRGEAKALWEYTEDWCPNRTRGRINCTLPPH